MVYKVFKRKFVFVIYIALLAFLSVYLFFKIQERDIIIRLNNNNLSLDAYKVTPKQNSSLAAFSEKVKNASALDDIQIHYQSKKDPRITYFYGKGDYDVPPMISGHFFSNADFDSAVPLLVVTNASGICIREEESCRTGGAYVKPFPVRQLFYSFFTIFSTSC